MDFARALVRGVGVHEETRAHHDFWSEFDAEVEEDWPVITPENLIAALVLVESHRGTLFILFKNDSVGETWALFILIDVDLVVEGVALVCWHEVNGLLMVAWEPTPLMSLLI